MADSDILGGCYCGTVRFQIAGGTQPAMAGFCHCLDCRQAHAAPVYQYVYVDSNCFRIVSGDDKLAWFTRSAKSRENFRRYFCRRCGSRVYNTLNRRAETAAGRYIGTFPTLFDNQQLATDNTWGPRKHVGCMEAILDLESWSDGLPRESRV